MQPGPPQDMQFTEDHRRRGRRIDRDKEVRVPCLSFDKLVDPTLLRDIPPHCKGIRRILQLQDLDRRGGTMVSKEVRTITLRIVCIPLIVNDLSCRTTFACRLSCNLM
jgi:hypothetical protein